MKKEKDFDQAENFEKIWFHAQEDLKKTPNLFLEYTQPYREIKDILENNIPAKTVTVSHTFEISAFVDQACPTCRGIISETALLENVCIEDKKVKLNFCPYCGQRLDWNKKKEN